MLRKYKFLYLICINQKLDYLPYLLADDRSNCAEYDSFDRQFDK